jgi:hypothetical protein
MARGLNFNVVFMIFNLYPKLQILLKEKIMRHISSSIIRVFVLIALLTQGCTPPDAALEIVEKSIAAHGGKKLWEAVEGVDYTKAIATFNAEGQLINEVLQKHRVLLQPFEAQLEWEDEEGQHIAQLKNDTIHRTLNSDPVSAAEKLAGAKASINGAHYVFWQPYRLLEPEAQRTFMGVRTLFNNTTTLEVKITYSTAPEADQWYYFFDASSFQLVATAVLHNGRMSLITNDAYENETGLLLNHKRTSYLTDENFQPLYKQASYIYTIKNLKMRP